MYILQGPRLELPRDADLVERLRSRGPIVTDIRQTVVDFDGWNVGTLCLVDEPDQAPGIVALRSILTVCSKG